MVHLCPSTRQHPFFRLSLIGKTWIRPTNTEGTNKGCLHTHSSHLVSKPFPTPLRETNKRGERPDHRTNRQANKRANRQINKQTIHEYINEQTNELSTNQPHKQNTKHKTQSTKHKTKNTKRALPASMPPLTWYPSPSRCHPKK